MQWTVTVHLVVSMDDSGANINEIVDAVQRARDQIGIDLARKVIDVYQERVVLDLCLGRAALEQRVHRPLRGGGLNCAGPSFKMKGVRPYPRKINSPIGRFEFPVRYAQCRQCGRKFAPVLRALGIGPWVRKTGTLEFRVLEQMAATNYRRGSRDLLVLGGVPVPRSTAHDWVTRAVLPPERSDAPADVILGDGTGFKKAAGCDGAPAGKAAKGLLRVVLGMLEGGPPTLLGAWMNTSWEDIGKQLAAARQEAIPARSLVSDQEPGLVQGLLPLAEGAQACQFHLIRDLDQALWQHEVGKGQRRSEQARLRGLIGVELPHQDYQQVSSADRETLQKRIEEGRHGIQQMIAEFLHRGYHRAATYLRHALDRVFRYVDLWLRIGIVTPRATGIVENVMREVGRRLKKIAYNWSDRGALKIVKVILHRWLEPARWKDFWERYLDLRGRCQILVQAIRFA